MNKYLEKVAKTVERPNKKSKQNFDKWLTSTLATGLAGTAGSIVGSIPLIRASKKSPSVDKYTIKKVLKSNKDLNVTFSPTKAFGGDSKAGEIYRDAISSSGPSYHNNSFKRDFYKSVSERKLTDISPSLKKINDRHRSIIKPLRRDMKKDLISAADIPFPGYNTAKRTRNTDIIFHELGHAKDLGSSSTSKLTKMLRQKSYLLSAKANNLGVGGAIGAAMLQNDKTKDYAWAAPVVTATPMLRGELAANINGYKMLKQHGTKAMGNSFLKHVAAKNMLSYGSGIAASALVLHGLNKLQSKRVNNVK